MTQFITILHTALRWLQQNVNQTSNSQQTPHTLPSRVSYGVAIMSISKIFDCVITAPYCSLEVQVPHEVTAVWLTRAPWVVTNKKVQKCNCLNQSFGRFSVAWPEKLTKLTYFICSLVVLLLNSKVWFWSYNTYYKFYNRNQYSPCRYKMSQNDNQFTWSSYSQALLWRGPIK